MGAGPNGETVFADSETALELFFFKHGIAQTVEKPKAPKAAVSYKDGQLTAEFDKASVTFMNRLQLRYTHQFPDPTTLLPGTADKGDSKGSFRIRRYEPQFQGWLFSKDLTFKLEFAFQDFQNAAVAAGGGINDAYFNYDFTHGKKAFRVQLGQFKVPFGRQELTTSFALQLVDRSITAGEYERGRDQGIQVDGLLFHNTIEYRAGLFNGNARSTTLNDNDKFQYDARVTWQPFGAVGYSEADFESKDKPLFALAGQYEQNDFANTVVVTATAPLPKVSACPCVAGGALKRESLGVDAVFKFKGLFLYGAYYDRKINPIAAGTTDFKSNGYNVEAGYLIGGPAKGKWEVTGRYASWDPTDQVGSNDRTETRFGLNWFYNKHFAKIQGDYGWTENKLAKTKDKEFRLQTQLYF
jgi:phosphate-selective porin OprO and OprP